MSKKNLTIIIAIILCSLIFCLILFSLIPKVKIEINGNKELIVDVGTEYIELGATACVKNFWQSKEIEIISSSNVNTFKIGDYEVTYKTTYHNKEYKTTRKVIVKDNVGPSITVNGDIKVCESNNIIELNVVAEDNYDGDISDKVTYKILNDKIYLSVIDSSNNESGLIKDIKYIDSEKPKITLNGKSTIELQVGDVYKEPGASAYDSCDGNLTSKIVTEGTVDINTIGTYIITYKIQDSKGNKSQISRTIKVKEKEITQLPSTASILYLTFDDGPGQYTEKLLNILSTNKVKATFFVTNQFPKYQNLIKREYEEGHAIGIHTYSHKWSVYNSIDDYLNDFTLMEQIVYNQTGMYPKIFRFPGGSSNTVSRSHCKGIMTDLTKIMTEKGYIYYDWSFDSGDTSKSKNSKNDIINTVKAHLNKPGQYIVLMHDIKKNTIDALPTIIAYAKEKGYQFKTLNESVAPVHFKVAN